jgi:uncharacterized membrane protein HdeD (DUF308 family)
MSGSDTAIGEARRATDISLGVSILLILLGMAAILLPEAVGIAVSILILWVIVFSGIAHLVHAWDARGSRVFLWQLLVGMLYMAGGLYLLLHPGYGMAYLTLFIACMFIFEALLLLTAFFWLRPMRESYWLALDGVLTLLIGIVIASGWPANSVWVLGVLVGINLLSSGFARLMIFRGGRGPQAVR